MNRRIFKTLLITLLLAGCFFYFLYFLGIKSEGYKSAVDFIYKNELIANKVGKLKNHRLAFWGHSVRYDGPHGYAQYKILVTGEKGRAEVYLDLEKIAGEWKVTKGNLLINFHGLTPVVLA